MSEEVVRASHSEAAPLASGRSGDPFGVVHLSELVPDRIEAHCFQMIRAHVDIEDLSDQLTFDDEWD